MSSKDFLDRIRKAGEKYSGSGGAGIIGRVIIETGLHRYVAGHEFWSFWKPVLDDKEMDVIGSELSARLQQAGCSDEPVFGIKITVKADVLGRDEPYKSDLQEFVPAWQGDAFELVCDAIEKGDLPIGEIFYGLVQYKANPFHVKKGEAGKTETDQNGKARFPSIRIPVEKFANEAAARAAASASGEQATTNSKWSETAQATYEGNMASLEDTADELLKYLELLKKGTPFPGYDLPQPLTPVSAKKQIAEIYGIETTDIDLLIPF
jgi:hypothetical protein